MPTPSFSHCLKNPKIVFSLMTFTKSPSPSFDSIIFDLDGTLWDACSATAAGWTNGLKLLGINRQISSNQIASVCGKPYYECVQTLIPEFSSEFSPEYPSDFSTQNIQQKILDSLDVEERKCVQANGGQLYPGVHLGIQELSKKFQLFIVSNCQHWYLESFLLHSNLTPFFVDVESYGRTNQPKSENIKQVVSRNKLTSPVYIGDTPSDQISASQANVPFIHATYGFGQCNNCISVNSFPHLTKHLTK